MLRFVPYIVVLVFLFSQCAQQTPLSGGERDKNPPLLDSTKQVTPPNGSLNFSASGITIPLNEYVKLIDKDKQILITPFLETNPDIYVKGKKVIVDFLEPLENNTTYIINFGNSIIDITEGNEMTNYKYVFSTGPFIDSLTYNAVVYDAFNKTPVQGAYVMLYKKYEDSVILKEKPNYFGVTDITGKCQIGNIAAGEYKVVSFMEDNGNYKWDVQSEFVGYSDNRVEAGKDTLADTLVLFKQLDDELKIDEVSLTTSGKGSISFAQPLSMEFDPNADSLLSSFSFSRSVILGSNRDSIHFFLNTDKQVGEKYAFGIDEIPSRKMMVPLKSDTSLHFKTNAEVGLKPNHDLDFVFTQPITTTDGSKIELRKNDKEIAYELVQTDYNRVSIEADWEEDEDYEITLFPGVVTSYRGLNNDTISAFVTVLKENDFGQLITKIKTPNGYYILELLQDGKVKYREYVSGEEISRTYKYLFPGNYRMRITFDQNSNQIWDTGNYFEHSQPERVEYYPEVIQIKKGWDADILWEIKE